MKYRTIVADPPWDLRWNANLGQGRSGRPGLPYPTLPLEEIKALPISEFAEDDAHIYVWTTHTFLWDTPAVLRAWGFKPEYLLVWAKNGLGMGGRFRHSSEYVLFGTRGKPLPVQRYDVGTWFNWTKGAHSAKPEAFLDLVETVSPGPYLELFARRNRLGWDTWGNEAIQHVELPA